MVNCECGLYLSELRFLGFKDYRMLDLVGWLNLPAVGKLKLIRFEDGKNVEVSKEIASLATGKHHDVDRVYAKPGITDAIGKTEDELLEEKSHSV